MEVDEIMEKIKESGILYCNGTTEPYDELYGCRLHLSYEHLHRVLDIDGKGVIEWDKEYCE